MKDTIKKYFMENHFALLDTMEEMFVLNILPSHLDFRPMRELDDALEDVSATKILEMVRNSYFNIKDDYFLYDGDGLDSYTQKEVDEKIHEDLDLLIDLMIIHSRKMWLPTDIEPMIKNFNIKRLSWEQDGERIRAIYDELRKTDSDDKLSIVDLLFHLAIDKHDEVEWNDEDRMVFIKYKII